MPTFQRNIQSLSSGLKLKPKWISSSFSLPWEPQISLYLKKIVQWWHSIELSFTDFGHFLVYIWLKNSLLQNLKVHYYSSIRTKFPITVNTRTKATTPSLFHPLLITVSYEAYRKRTCSPKKQCTEYSKRSCRGFICNISVWCHVVHLHRVKIIFISYSANVPAFRHSAWSISDVYKS